MYFQRHIAPQLFIQIHQILCKFSKICSFEISQKTIRNPSKDCHAAFSLSLNTASNCWYLKICLILRTNKHTCFYFLISEPVNFPHKHVNAGPFTSKAFTKFFISPNLICTAGGKTLLGFIKGLCVTFFITGVNNCLWG